MLASLPYPNISINIYGYEGLGEGQCYFSCTDNELRQKTDIWGVVQQNYGKSGWKTSALFKEKNLNSKTLFLVV